MLSKFSWYHIKYEYVHRADFGVFVFDVILILTKILRRATAIYSHVYSRVHGNVG